MKGAVRGEHSTEMRSGSQGKSCLDTLLGGPASLVQPSVGTVSHTHASQFCSLATNTATQRD